MKTARRTVKTLALFAIFLFAVFVNLLSDYISFAFDASIFCDTAYWMNVLVLNAGVFIVIMICRSYSKDRELFCNSDFIETQKAIDDAYIEFNKRKLCTEFNDYIAYVNRENKLKAYTDNLNRKLKRCKDEAQRKALSNLLERAERDIGFIRVRYGRVKVASVFGRTNINIASEYDIDEHEARAVMKLLLQKVFGILAFSLIFTSMLLSSREFSLVMLYSSALKMLQVATGVYIGFAAGTDYVTGEVLVKAKLRLSLIQRFLERRNAKAAEQA